jgi:Fe-S-cluster containining protein
MRYNEISLECNKCGKCCYNWDIRLSKKDIIKLNKLGLKINEFAEIKNSLPLIKFNNNKCIFLDTDNSCIIQNEYGFFSKPQVCQEFPYNDYICGDPIKKKNKKNRFYGIKDDYFRINNKIIETDIFLRLLNNLDPNKSLFESYCNLLYNIMNYNEEIIIKKFNVKEYDLKISKKLIKRLENSILKLSKKRFPRLRLRLNKEITINFPLEEKKLLRSSIRFSKEINQELLIFIQYNTLRRKTYKDYPIYLLFNLYFIERLDSNKDHSDLMNIIKSFSLLNSLIRFRYPQFNDFKTECSKINFDLENYIRV